MPVTPDNGTQCFPPIFTFGLRCSVVLVQEPLLLEKELSQDLEHGLQSLLAILKDLMRGSKGAQEWMLQKDGFGMLRHLLSSCPSATLTKEVCTVCIRTKCYAAATTCDAVGSQRARGHERHLRPVRAPCQPHFATHCLGEGNIHFLGRGRSGPRQSEGRIPEEGLS